MQKKLFLSAALGLAMFANTAFAEVNTAYLANELRSYPGWPLEVYCNATDVNVRTQPNTDCAVITMLQKGDKFYVSRVVNVENSEYTWLLGTTEKGHVGFMASKYLDVTPKAASAAGRFNAAWKQIGLWIPRFLLQVPITRGLWSRIRMILSPMLIRSCRSDRACSI